MKIITLVFLLGTFGAATAKEMRDAATHEQLVATYRQASQEDPLRKQIVTRGPDPSTVNRPKDLISDSDIICYNGAVTLVPKRAILQTPKTVMDRLKYQQGAKLMSWGDFYAMNRGWITTVEVSRTQAEGNLPLAPETEKQLTKSGNLVVATFQGGPISVLPLKVPDEKTATITPPKS